MTQKFNEPEVERLKTKVKTQLREQAKADMAAFSRATNITLPDLSKISNDVLDSLGVTVDEAFSIFDGFLADLFHADEARQQVIIEMNKCACSHCQYIMQRADIEVERRKAENK